MNKTIYFLIACACLFACTNKDEPQKQEEPITITAPSSLTITRMKLHSEPIAITGWDGWDMAVDVKDQRILRADYSAASGKLNLMGLEVGNTTVALSYKTAKATISVTIQSDKYRMGS